MANQQSIRHPDHGTAHYHHRHRNLAQYRPATHHVPELNGLAYCGAAIVISGALLAVSAKSSQKNT
ncbi:hypothetical protein [Suttonella indologenes]|uniref:hypothetical protein n=1 Tax=Suttonella indologenes TaxID=13276 RepID=UPI0011C022E1|nr:hypothetical protein [Suttonella indologenes]